MTLHRNRFLVNETNRCTALQFYWYYYSKCFGQPFCPSSGVLSRTLALVHFMQLWSFATRSKMDFHPTPGSKRSQLHKVHQSRCTAKNSWWWAERLPETCRLVIPIKLEFSASVDFIHKKNLCPCGEFNSECPDVLPVTYSVILVIWLYWPRYGQRSPALSVLSKRHMSNTDANQYQPRECAGRWNIETG